MGSRGFDSIYSWGSATVRGLLLVRIVNPIMHTIIMRAQGHLPPRAVVHVRTSAEAPRGARHRPPGSADGFRRDGGNEAAAVAEKCKGRREEILQVTHVKRVYGSRADGAQSTLGLEIRKPNFFFRSDDCYI